MEIQKVKVADHSGRIVLECGVSSTLILLFIETMVELGYTITKE